MVIATPILDRVRTWLADSELPETGRLPPERALAERFGVKRAELRKALAMLEMEGALWRKVGKGTFLIEQKKTASDTASIADRTSPPDAMEARLLLEPGLARLAAVRATLAQLNEMRALARAMRNADTWRRYEELDLEFHRLIATASGNELLEEIHRVVNEVRRAVVWKRLDTGPGAPPPDYHSFDEHDRLIEAIANRDREGAARAMAAHLESTAALLIDA